MGRQIIKQPNGKYCVYSSIVDNVTIYNATPNDIIEEWATEARIDIERKVTEIIAQLEKGDSPYNQFTQSFDEMLNTIKETHGKSELRKLQKLIESNTKEYT